MVDGFSPDPSGSAVTTPRSEVLDAWGGAADADIFLPTRYAGAVLVCAKCEKRDKGPRKLTTKTLRFELRQALGGGRSKLRIVQTSCLGLCPRKAIAVAAVTPEAGSVLAAVRRERDVPALAAGLVAAAPTTPHI
ncbi:hypothetical protein [Xylophilus ampelinus]|uniref:(2Fe-2S) ferredoxin domain-containing protein n=1 Tax=Xylophilus ampelinus TaxID=54067 RepID=A0A318SP71_9BURK|nr:hypothetical protein [Xylophilus ampelinus]MCS4509447.1 hypothetical protein [Xylophilus ampelinus]PYE79174.1 hypothetical protein DFQ15_103162 [Xylophilus ampelinus]